MNLFEVSFIFFSFLSCDACFVPCVVTVFGVFLKVFLGQTQRSGVFVVQVVVSGSVCACGLKGCALLSRL